MTFDMMRLWAGTPRPADAAAPAPPRPISWLRVALATLVGVQAALLGFVLWLLGGGALHAPMELEARPLIKTPSVVVSRDDVVDCLHCFSGSGEVEESASPLRRQLLPDPGQFSWIVLADSAAASGELLPMAARRGMARTELARFRRALGDGVLNFFYDTGGREDFFRHNWSVVGAGELQASPLLPWEKGIDFVVLSSYQGDHAGGLPFIASLNPRLPIFAPPPHPDEGEAPALAVRGLQRVIPLPRGLHRLSGRLSSYVYETRPEREAGDRSRHYAAALIVALRQGPLLVNGTDGIPPHVLIPRVEQALGRRLCGYAGATGYRMGTEDAGTVTRLTALARSHPGFRMAPGYGTSDTAHAMLRRLFGEAGYQAGLLGARIRLQ